MIYYRNSKYNIFSYGNNLRKQKNIVYGTERLTYDQGKSSNIGEINRFISCDSNKLLGIINCNKTHIFTDPSHSIFSFSTQYRSYNTNLSNQQIFYFQNKIYSYKPRNYLFQQTMLIHNKMSNKDNTKTNVREDIHSILQPALDKTEINYKSDSVEQKISRPIITRKDSSESPLSLSTPDGPPVIWSELLEREEALIELQKEASTFSNNSQPIPGGPLIDMNEGLDARPKEVITSDGLHKIPYNFPTDPIGPCTHGDTIGVGRKPIRLNLELLPQTQSATLSTGDWRMAFVKDLETQEYIAQVAAVYGTGARIFLHPLRRSANGLVYLRPEYNDNWIYEGIHPNRVLTSPNASYFRNMIRLLHITKLWPLWTVISKKKFISQDKYMHVFGLVPVKDALEKFGIKKGEKRAPTDGMYETVGRHTLWRAIHVWLYHYTVRELGKSAFPYDKTDSPFLKIYGKLGKFWLAFRRISSLLALQSLKRTERALLEDINVHLDEWLRKSGVPTFSNKTERDILMSSVYSFILRLDEVYSADKFQFPGFENAAADELQFGLLTKLCRETFYGTLQIPEDSPLADITPKVDPDWLAYKLAEYIEIQRRALSGVTVNELESSTWRWLPIRELSSETSNSENISNAEMLENKN